MHCKNLSKFCIKYLFVFRTIEELQWRTCVYYIISCCMWSAMWKLFLYSNGYFFFKNKPKIVTVLHSPTSRRVCFMYLLKYTTFPDDPSLCCRQNKLLLNHFTFLIVYHKYQRFMNMIYYSYIKTKISFIIHH